jgi:hypothetical protein
LSNAIGIIKIRRIERVVPVHTEGYAVFVTRTKGKGLFKISRGRLKNSNQIDPKEAYSKDEAKIRAAWYRNQC